MCYHGQLSVFLQPGLIARTIAANERQFLQSITSKCRVDTEMWLVQCDQVGAKGMEPRGCRMHSVRGHTYDLLFELEAEGWTSV